LAASMLRFYNRADSQRPTRPIAKLVSITLYTVAKNTGKKKPRDKKRVLFSITKTPVVPLFLYANAIVNKS